HLIFDPSLAACVVKLDAIQKHPFDGEEQGPAETVAGQPFEERSGACFLDQALEDRSIPRVDKKPPLWIPGRRSRLSAINSAVLLGGPFRMASAARDLTAGSGSRGRTVSGRTRSAARGGVPPSIRH